LSSHFSVPISLDQLAALNDEIAALARAGVPLDRGLRALGRDLPGRLGRVTESLGRRLESGEDLTIALANAGATFPPVYRAVVMAGLKSGRLASALEGVSTTVRRVAEVRRVTVISMIYPVIVFSVATFVLIFSTTQTIPAVAESYASFGIEPPAWYTWLYSVSLFLSRWLIWIWVAVTAAIIAWYFCSGRSTAMGGRSGRATTVRGMLRLGRVATFAEILALLVQQDVPLDEAVVLAGEASGDSGLAQGSAALAERIRAGQSGGPPIAEFPPLLGWLLASRPQREPLIRALHQAAAAYRQRAERTANWLGLYLPILMSAGVGGLAALFYGLLIFAPVYHVLYQLG